MMARIKETGFFMSCFKANEDTECPEDTKTPEEVLKEYLEPCKDVDPPPKVTVEDFIARSDAFPIPFPVQTARVKTFLENGIDKEALEDKINSAYPVIHERLLPLIAMFIHKKKQYGTRKEKKLYASMTLLELVDRLLKKRPVSFCNRSDDYMLKDGTEGFEGFENIGQSRESRKLCIAEYMTYDEMKISALLSVSSKSFFINDGSRKNKGIPGDSGSFQPDGVIVGMVGARMQRPGVMEYQDCVVTPEQNTKALGYGEDPPENLWLVKEWGNLWNTTLPTWEEVGDDSLKGVLRVKFNTEVYKARIQMTAEVLLIEASSRAAAVGLKAYVHVVGLGLGVWQANHNQNEYYVDAFGNALAAVDTTNIGHLDFSWISTSSCHGASEGEKFPNTDVILHFSWRNLHDPVPEGMLLVDCYAWDGNSLPGNEYWKGSISSSGDPAAACSSQVAELLNSFINPQVTAENLHIASYRGVEHIAQYTKHFLET